MRLTLNVIKETGVFTNACEKWRDKLEAEQTMANFITHFNCENRECIRKLTVKQAGFHGANTATNKTTSVTPTTKPTPKDEPNHSIKTNNGTTMYYCWMHGLGKNCNHTSVTCKNKGEGHKDEATADNMMGGNNKIMSGCPPRNTTAQR